MTLSFSSFPLKRLELLKVTAVNSHSSSDFQLTALRQSKTSCFSRGFFLQVEADSTEKLQIMLFTSLFFIIEELKDDDHLAFKSQLSVTSSHFSSPLIRKIEGKWANWGSCPALMHEPFVILFLNFPFFEISKISRPEKSCAATYLFLLDSQRKQNDSFCTGKGVKVFFWRVGN